MNIIEAMDDPALFGPSFKGPSWAAWRAYLAALFALPMTDEALEIYRRYTGRTVAPCEPSFESAISTGRRGGKSRILALIACYLATMRDYEPHLSPGEVATVAVLAANRAQARSIFRYTAGLMATVPMLKALITDQTSETITLSNRVVIEISTASFRTTRGYTYAACLLDEISFWRSDESSANPAGEILRALRPGMASIPGSILLMASSPYSKSGPLYDAYRRHYGKNDARVLMWKSDTAGMNPRIPKRIIEEAYEADPESARAEYGGEFRDDLADFLTIEAVQAVTCQGRRELPPTPGLAYSAFVDPSGGASDSMTLAIAHLEGEIGVLDVVLEVRPPFNPDDAVISCVDLLRRFGVSQVVGDRYAGAWPVARFAAHGITFSQSARPKSDIYGDFGPLVNAKRIELLEHTRLAAQLTGLERRTARGGRDSIDHPPGAHDDICNCVAGVLVGLDLDRRPALVRHQDLLTGGRAVQELAKCNAVFCVIASNAGGYAAAVYCALSWRGVAAPLVVLDFDIEPLSPGLFGTVAEKGLQFVRTHGARDPNFLIMALPALARLAAVSGVPVQPIPEQFLDVAELTVSASLFVMAGDVKLFHVAEERAKTIPFAGALDFRAGTEVGDDPLRHAALLAIALSMEDQGARRRTVAA